MHKKQRVDIRRMTRSNSNNNNKKKKEAKPGNRKREIKKVKGSQGWVIRFIFMDESTQKKNRNSYLALRKQRNQHNQTTALIE